MARSVCTSHERSQSPQASETLHQDFITDKRAKAPRAPHPSSPALAAINTKTYQLLACESLQPRQNDTRSRSLAGFGRDACCFHVCRYVGSRGGRKYLITLCKYYVDLLCVTGGNKGGAKREAKNDENVLLFARLWRGRERRPSSRLLLSPIRDGGTEKREEDDDGGANLLKSFDTRAFLFH
jgi:hypothetical protein